MGSRVFKKPRFNIKPPNQTSLVDQWIKNVNTPQSSTKPITNDIPLIDLTLDDEDETHTPITSTNSSSSFTTPQAPSKATSIQPTSSSSTTRINTHSSPPSPIHPLTLTLNSSPSTSLELGTHTTPSSLSTSPQPLTLTLTLSPNTPFEFGSNISSPSLSPQPLMGYPILYPLHSHTLSCACCHHNFELIMNLRDELSFRFSYLEHLLTPPIGPIILPPPPPHNSPN